MSAKVARASCSNAARMAKSLSSSTPTIIAQKDQKPKEVRQSPLRAGGCSATIGWQAERSERYGGDPMELEEQRQATGTEGAGSPRLPLSEQVLPGQPLPRNMNRP